MPIPISVSLQRSCSFKTSLFANSNITLSMCYKRKILCWVKLLWFPKTGMSSFVILNQIQLLMYFRYNHLNGGALVNRFYWLVLFITQNFRDVLHEKQIASYFKFIFCIWKTQIFWVNFCKITKIFFWHFNIIKLW